jgi:5-formyltetrahydrofolate cyclo-ligase
MLAAKENLRRRMLAIRGNMPPQKVADLSQRIRLHLNEVPSFIEAKTIIFYASIRNEVITDHMIGDALSMGKKVALPKVVKDQRRLVISYIDDLDALMPGAYGIREPRDIRPVPLNSVDLVVVPGVAFDMKGYRLGHGGGYYDIFLSEMGEGVIKIGLAFEFQLVGKLPIEEHDIKVDTILTEKRIIIT